VGVSANMVQCLRDRSVAVGSWTGRRYAHIVATALTGVVASGVDRLIECPGTTVSCFCRFRVSIHGRQATSKERFSRTVGDDCCARSALSGQGANCAETLLQDRLLFRPPTEEVAEWKAGLASS
jgi:hypothetical protein